MAVNRSSLYTKIHKVLKKHYKPVAPNARLPLMQQLLYACCLETASAEAADKALAALENDYYDWNEVRARVIGNPPRIDVWINGTKISEFQDTEKRLPDYGRIGIQVHGGQSWPVGKKTRFRNIRIQELP